MRSIFIGIAVAAALSLSACGGKNTSSNSAASTAGSSTNSTQSSGGPAGTNAANSADFCSSYGAFVSQLQIIGSVDLSNLMDLEFLQGHFESFVKEVPNSTLKDNLGKALAILNPLISNGGSGSNAQRSSLKDLVTAIFPALDTQAKALNCSGQP